jgi:hypothetical protein
MDGFAAIMDYFYCRSWCLNTSYSMAADFASVATAFVVFVAACLTKHR